MRTQPLRTRACTRNKADENHEAGDRRQHVARGKAVRVEDVLADMTSTSCK